MTEIFEIVDATDPESWYTMGLFASLPEAVAAIDGIDDPRTIATFDGPDPDGRFVVEIRKRTMGLGGMGDVVLKRTWEEVFDEAEDISTWKVVPTP